MPGRFERNDYEWICRSLNDLFGPMDIGAYELQQAPVCVAADTIFCNGFEN